MKSDKFDYVEEAIRAGYYKTIDKPLKSKRMMRKILRKLARAVAMEMAGTFLNHKKNAQQIARKLIP